MVLCSGAVGWGNVTANRKATKIATDVTQTLRRDLFSKISGLSCAQADRYASASLVSRLTNDTYNVYELFDKLQRGGTRAPLMVIGGLFLTFALEPWLALIQFAASGLTLLAVWAVTARGVPYYTQAQSAVDTMTLSKAIGTYGVAANLGLRISYYTLATKMHDFIKTGSPTVGYCMAILLIIMRTCVRPFRSPGIRLGNLHMTEKRAAPFGAALFSVGSL